MSAQYRKSRVLGPDGRQLVVRMSSYEAAGQGRRGGTWAAPSTGPNAALLNSLTTLRNRSRAAYRNTPWLSLGIDRQVSNEVGTGIIPRSLASNEGFRDAANGRWDQVVGYLDADGALDFYGLQALASRTRRIAGEVFVRRRRRPLGHPSGVTVQFQVLEPEYVPLHLDRPLPNGNFIRAGVEFDRRFQRRAYWFHREHPTDGVQYSGLRDFVRVPAADVLHHYLPVRPGQVRGEPVTVQSLLKAHTFDLYEDAELVRKQTRAPYTGFLARQDFGAEDFKYDPLTGEPITTDDQGVPTMDVQPGTILTGLPGEELQLFSGDDSGQGYADFMRQQLLGMSAGLGVPYELLTGDWGKVNDRLVRAILHEFRRQIEADQDHLMIHQICAPCRSWWIDAEVLAGTLRAPGYAADRADYQRTEWRPHGWPYLHPEQDIGAKIAAIQGGLSTRAQEVASRGHYVEDIDDENARDRDRAEEAGLNYTVYPGAENAPAAEETTE